MDKYLYAYILEGFIHGEIINKNLNVHLSFTNLIETEKILDFAALNSYIYNISNNKSNSCLVMIVPLNAFYLVPYTTTDYSLRHGYISTNIKNKLRRKGTHCRTCKNECKPLFINGLDRLDSLI